MRQFFFNVQNFIILNDILMFSPYNSFNLKSFWVSLAICSVSFSFSKFFSKNFEVERIFFEPKTSSHSVKLKMYWCLFSVLIRLLSAFYKQDGFLFLNESLLIRLCSFSGRKVHIVSVFYFSISFPPLLDLIVFYCP